MLISQSECIHSLILYLAIRLFVIFQLCCVGGRWRYLILYKEYLVYPMWLDWWIKKYAFDRGNLNLAEMANALSSKLANNARHKATCDNLQNGSRFWLRNVVSCLKKRIRSNLNCFLLQHMSWNNLKILPI